MMHLFSAFRALLCVCCLSWLAACGTGSDAADVPAEVVTKAVTETVTERQTVTVTPPAGADDTTGGGGGGAVQPFPADTTPDRAVASGAQLILTDVRVGTHDGYDRVTFEFSGDGAPGWVVEYTDDPRAQGSGQPVDVDGSAVLQASMTAVAPPMTDEAYQGPDRITAQRLQVIEEVVVGTTFEAYLEAFVGVDQEVPFRARRFDDPPRVVIDIVHPGRVDQQ